MPNRGRMSLRSGIVPFTLCVIFLFYGKGNAKVLKDKAEIMCAYDLKGCVSIRATFENVTYEQARNKCINKNCTMPKKWELHRFAIETYDPAWVYSPQSSEEDSCYVYEVSSDIIDTVNCSSKHDTVCIDHIAVHVLDNEVLCRDGEKIIKGQVCSISNCTRNEVTCPDNSCVAEEKEEVCVKFDETPSTPAEPQTPPTLKVDVITVTRHKDEKTSTPAEPQTPTTLITKTVDVIAVTPEPLTDEEKADVFSIVAIDAISAAVIDVAAFLVVIVVAVLVYKRWTRKTSPHHLDKQAERCNLIQNAEEWEAQGDEKEWYSMGSLGGNID